MRSRTRYQRQVDPDEAEYAPTQRRKLYRDYKVFNDNLGPLYRYLKSQCGRPWNKVYAEICAVAKSDSVLHAHLREHVHGYVLSDQRPHPYLWAQFVVDKHGILRMHPRPRYVRAPVVFRGVPVTETTGYVYEHSSWYEVEFGNVDVPGYVPAQPREFWALYSTGDERIGFVKKRALSSKEIKKLELRGREPA